MNRYIAKMVKEDPLDALRKMVEEAKKDPEKLRALNSGMRKTYGAGVDPKKLKD